MAARAKTRLFLDVRQNDHVRARTAAGRAAAEGPQTTRADIHHPALALDRERPSVVFDQPEPHDFWRAKKGGGGFNRSAQRLDQRYQPASGRQAFAAASPPHPAAAQMGRQLFLKTATRLNGPAFADRLMRCVHARVSGIPGLQPPSDLRWRPLARQLSGHQFAQGRVECQLTGLGTAGAIQCKFVSPGGASASAAR